ncbi:MAG: DUF4873 domain-containing protein [Mycobacterium sp.]
MNENGVNGIIVIGDPSRTHGYFSHYALAHTAAAKRFDNDSDTWTVTTTDGQTLTGRVLVDTTPRDDDIVAAHGIPNHFRIPGPHTERQARYVAACIDAMNHSGSTRFEARSRVRVHRLLPTRGLSRFYLTGSVGVDDEIYDGPAVLIYDGQEYQTRVRLAGHFDPIDGQYHWQGMLYADLLGEKVIGSQVSVRIGEHTATARISEQTPWGTLSVAGAAGYPPFPLADVEISMPPRL